MNSEDTQTIIFICFLFVIVCGTISAISCLYKLQNRIQEEGDENMNPAEEVVSYTNNNDNSC